MNSGEVTETSTADEGRRRILEAFKKARDSGKPNWTEMTTAVLKNRLLVATERAFKEQDYGVSSFTAFVRKYPDILALDESSTPPKVILLEDLSNAALSDAMAAGRRIRTDLWNAIIDYRSGLSYYWTGSEAVSFDELPEGGEAGLLAMPTVSPTEMSAWRSDFAQKMGANAALDENDRHQIQRWCDDSLTTMGLPPRARGLWNEELKQNVINRLSEWFRDNGLTLPSDLVQRRAVSRQAVSSEAAQLRELVLRCVRVMTEEELRELRLPPSVLLRISG